MGILPWAMVIAIVADDFVLAIRSPAVVIDPSLIAEEETRWVDVNSDYTLDYGRSLGYRKQGPAGTRQARILMRIDETRFWDLMIELLQ